MRAVTLNQRVKFSFTTFKSAAGGRNIEQEIKQAAELTSWQETGWVLLLLLFMSDGGRQDIGFLLNITPPGDAAPAAC